jgi:hypothetical protein
MHCLKLMGQSLMARDFDRQAADSIGSPNRLRKSTSAKVIDINRNKTPAASHVGATAI